jgi:hypothetical protein
MVSKPKVLSSNLDSIIHPIFNYIPHVGPHLLNDNLSSHMSGSVKVLIK